VHLNNRRIARDRDRIAARFWSKVNKAGRLTRQELGVCWEWTACLDKKGYGRITVALENGKQRVTGAHRVAWFLEHGRWPEPMALHRCDNPLCVRPDHLFEGDVVDNFYDMRAKGRERHPRGEHHPRAILTEEQVISLRAASARRPREKHKQVAERLGISIHTLRAALRGVSWSHVT
jgi:hypothetical protein